MSLVRNLNFDMKSCKTYYVIGNCCIDGLMFCAYATKMSSFWLKGVMVHDMHDVELVL